MWPFLAIPFALYFIYVFYFYIPQEKTEIPVGEVVNLPDEAVKFYVKKHALLAQSEMKSHNIPASITLAQAILESQYGTSELALQANNHFGIKADEEFNTTSRHCLHSNEWKKDSQQMEAILSCFKKYQKVAECYSNHSEFLKNRKWYAHLFELDSKDYINWAQGLQDAGYATDPKYADKLVGIIKKYKLASYDTLNNNNHGQ